MLEEEKEFDFDVSIPLWFLRNESLDAIKNFSLEGFHTTMVLTQHRSGPRRAGDWCTFPYHYGSYATRQTHRVNHLIYSFHTTMVLTQRPNRQTRSICHNRVSIPLWFLRNNNITTVEFELHREFPYHYGSYATMPCQGDQLDRRQGFHTTMVLTQPIDDLFGKIYWLVSIPLWFLRNGRGEECGVGEGYKFPYHYGSYATLSWVKNGLSPKSSFHTTMVLTQLNQNPHQKPINV